MGEPARSDLLGVAGPTEPNDHGAEASDRAGSGEMSGSAAADDPSRSRFAEGTGLRADHRNGGPGSVWPAGRDISGTGARRGSFGGLPGPQEAVNPPSAVASPPVTGSLL